MRLHFRAVMPAVVMLVGLVFALSASTSASEVDPASAMQGSLGVSFDDLSTSAGVAVFLLNVGCVLLFAAACIALTRRGSRTSRRVPLRPGSQFAR